MRRRLIKNAPTRIQSHPEIVVMTPVEYKGRWYELFRNRNPIYLEIGMGKGGFLLKMAQKYPNINFIGIEKFDSIMVIAVEKIASLKLPNLLLIKSDAEQLTNFFEPGEISQVFLNFSDPWPKNRHEKRRLTSSQFLKSYEQILKPAAPITLKTDNKGLFEYSVVSMSMNKWTIEELSLDLHKHTNDIVTTEYEERFIALGQPIYYVKATKG